MRIKVGLIIGIMMLALFSACKEKELHNADETENDVIEEKETIMETEATDVKLANEVEELISVDEFKNKYNLLDTEIPNEYIEKYIEYYMFTKSDLANSLVNHGERVKSDYEEGKQYGYSLEAKLYASRQIDKSEISDESLENIEYIFIEFSRTMSQSDAYSFELMSIDFNAMKIYYGGDRKNYSDAEEIKFAELTEEDKEEISKDIRNHIKFDSIGNKSIQSEDYSFDLWIITNDKQFIRIEGADKDEEGFPGFDGYWKELYNKYFGEEYAFPY